MALIAQINAPRTQFLDGNGAPLVGGTVSTYIPGTTTAVTTYQDPTGNVANTMPAITLDDLGSCSIFYDGLVRLIVRDADGNQIYDQVTGAAGPLTVGPFSSLSSAFLPTGVDYIQASGYNAAGDGSYPRYRYDAAVNSGYVAAHPRSSFISANGRGFRVALDGWANSKWWGALGGLAATAVNNATWSTLPDDTAALQECINYCRDYNVVMYTPAGGYKSGPLTAWKWDGAAFQFSTFRWIGDGRGGDSGGAAAITAIRALSNDNFCLAIQAGRSCFVTGIQFLGQNITFVGGATICDPTAYFNGGTRTDRYSPHSGIAIDPIGTSAIPTGSRYPGFEAFYTASTPRLTADCKFEDVGMAYFTCAAILTAGGVDGQTSEISWTKCTFSNSAYGYVSTATQADNAFLNDCSFATLYKCIDGKTFGGQNGRPPIVKGANAGLFMHFLNVPMSTSQGVHIDNLHTESCGGLGFIGASNAAFVDGTLITNSHFNIGGTGDVFADFFMIAYGNVEFQNCYIETGANPAPAYRMWLDQGKYVSFSGNTNIGGGTVYGPALGGEICLVPTADESYKYKFPLAMIVNDSNGGTNNGNNVIAERLVASDDGGIDRYYVCSGQTIQFTVASSPTVQRIIPQAVQQQSLGAAVTVTRSGNTATFTAADIGILKLGDYICCTDTISTWEKYDGTLTFSAKNVCFGIVSAIDGGTSLVTLSCIPQNLLTGSYNLVVQWWSRFHRDSVGDTHSNTTVDNVTNASTWKKGDRISGAGIPAATYITDVTGTTITLSKAATATASAQALTDAKVYTLTMV